MAPVVEDPVPLVDAHRSQARVPGTPMHLLPSVEDRLPRIVLGLIILVLGLGVFLIKIAQRQARGGNLGGKGMKSASFARQGVHVVGSQTRNCFLPQTCRHLVHSTEPTLRPATISCADALMHPQVVHASKGLLRRTPEWTR